MFWIIVGFFFLLSLIVSQTLKSRFRRYSQVGLRANMTGREIALQMLADHGIYDVDVMCVEGQLTDHYNPSNRTVNLSPDVYYGNSAAAAAVAAHECGHAVQHATAYSMLEFRSAMVPLQNISASVMNFIFIASLFGFAYNLFSASTILLTIIACYGVITLFSFITLPVEFDASRRALAWIEARGIASPQEYGMASDALRWAAMTYVVAALGSLAMLLYYVSIFMGRD
ncbi:zinc metallopeptidase [Eisenibacter elegans]|jgi:Zn-dependent membrane protease YugP|uniref:zinc metallopeptidase n=1 Tax=Eisenibacter elegans TaxID=997 RepID=UPI0003F50066|nr:zinc metallopeptidase [Eisenibacter elegans]